MQSVWSTRSRVTRLVGVVALALAATAAVGQSASGAEVTPPTVELTALTGPQGGTLAIEIAPAVKAIEHVHLRLSAPDAPEGAEPRTLNLKNVPADDGVATIELGPVPRGTSVDAQVQIKGRAPPRTADENARGSLSLTRMFVVRGSTIARLRPDLRVTAVHAPPQTLSTRPIDVVADISERNGETDATATVTLMLGPTPLSEPALITVSAGETASKTFEAVKLTSPMSAELTVRVTGAEPFETDATNNAGTGTVEVTEHELVRTNVLVPSLGGYGAQFNQHVYAPITAAPAGSLAGLEEKVKALEPQLVRIFYNDNWEERRPDAPQNMASFIETVRLAHEAGATINITYQTASVARLQPGPSMARFADVLESLVRVHELTNVRWVTIQNEPNLVGNLITLDQYKTLNRTIHDELVARGLRDHIKLMGGDLVESAGARHHTIWFEYMAEHMSDILDAYSVHIYWNYWDIPRMEFRLKDVRRIVTAMEGEARKPTYVMEMGVRGILNMPGKPTFQPGYWADGTQLSRTNIAAFQQLWFDLAAAQLGFEGSLKWDAFWGKYDLTYNASYFLIGPPEEGWPLFPSYHALRLLLQTTQRGWEVVRVDPWAEDDWRADLADQREKEIAAYASAGGHVTLMGLDSHGGDLNALSDEAPDYSIGGLPASTKFNLALWNAAGDGANTLAGTVRTDAAGVARFEVPLHAAFSLTTVPVS